MTKIGGAWLTVNRYCNFRCPWCYAEGTSYKKSDDMTISRAKEIVRFCKSIGVRSLILIGGEPSYWPKLFELIEYIKLNNMTSGLVTNGYLLHSNKFIEKITKSEIDYVNISLKAGSKKGYQKLTGSDSFAKVVSGIQNMNKADIPFDVSITVNSLVIDSLEELIKVAHSHGSKKVSLQFCATTFKNKEPQKGFMLNPGKVAQKVVHCFESLKKDIKDSIFIEQSLPRCVWPEGFIEEFENEGRIAYGCHLSRKEGLVFDTKGKLIPCNCLSDFKIASLGDDFYDYRSFYSFWEKPDLVSFYNNIISYPSEKCIKCDKYDLCGGGCPLQWFVFQPEKILS